MAQPEERVPSPSTLDDVEDAGKVDGYEDGRLTVTRKDRMVFLLSLLYNRAAVGLGGRIMDRRWYNEIAPGVNLGALPSRSLLRQLSNGQPGTLATLNMCCEHSGHASYCRRHGITQLQLPTRDFTTPSCASIASAIAFIRGQRTLGRTVYLHCKAGKGRSATVALCYLVQLHRITADEAQALLLQLRPQVDRDIASRPEVSEYIRTLDFHPPAAESEDDD